MAQAILQAKAKGSTVIVITHRPGTLSVVDKILILREGSLAAYGPRDEVLAALRQPAPALTVQTPEKG